MCPFPPVARQWGINKYGNFSIVRRAQVGIPKSSLETSLVAVHREIIQNEGDSM